MTIATSELKSVQVPKAKRGRLGIDVPMTYRQYMASPEEMRRYDILDGIKIYRLYGVEQLPNPTRRHNDIVMNVTLAFRDFERRTGTAHAIAAPCDVLITRRPLHTRQPDASLIGNERLARNPPPNNPAPLDPSPELVVEIVSPSDRPSVLAAKISDYRAVAAREIWIVRPAENSVEVVALSVGEIATVATYTLGENVVSVAFPGLVVAVADVFRE